jgi:hypothetical protein
MPMNQRIAPLATTSVSCFLRQLVNDCLGPDACPTVQIINDNARVFVPERQLVEEPNVSNERQDKAQLHITSRWEGSPEAKCHGLLQDAQLGPMPRRRELEDDEVTREDFNIVCARDRWSTFESGTVRGLDEPQMKGEGRSDIHSTSLRKVTTLSPLELPYSESDVTIHEMERGYQNARLVHLTTRGILISSCSPRLPRRRKSSTELFLQ